MSRLRSIWVVGLTSLAVLIFARWSLHAEDETAGLVAMAPEAAEEGARPSIVAALERPFHLPFGEPTRIDEVCKHLGRVLNAPVVLDIAALDRLDLREDDPVQLSLEGVRLKTGLKLLLDQLGLTYRVVPEDNLLIVTDTTGADDPLNRVHAELKSIHRDLHEIQDAVDDLRDVLGVGGKDEGATLRKPTIIEEMPGTKDAPQPPPMNNATPRPRSG